MTTLTEARPASISWAQVRSMGFHDSAPSLIAMTAPDGLAVQSVRHLRTAHYAVYRVGTQGGQRWVVRVGPSSEDDETPTNNSGYQGTSLVSPSGQRRELEIAKGFASAGAAVAVPAHYVRSGGLEFLWMPFLVGSGRPLTAGQWHNALTALQNYRPEIEIPVFTNRAKSFARLDELPDNLTIRLRNSYDTRMEALFEAATSWSVVHGDAHAGNVLNIDGRAVLFDFDTSCWAPSVWDLTHLLNRSGTGENTGYTPQGLSSLFPFTAAEVDAAMQLRRVAAEIAREHRVHTPVRG